MAVMHDPFMDCPMNMNDCERVFVSQVECHQGHSIHYAIQFHCFQSVRDKLEPVRVNKRVWFNSLAWLFIDWTGQWHPTWWPIDVTMNTDIRWSLACSRFDCELSGRWTEWMFVFAQCTELIGNLDLSSRYCSNVHSSHAKPRLDWIPNSKDQDHLESCPRVESISGPMQIVQKCIFF